VAVSDADVIIKLYQANHLNLLGKLFTEVVVPGKVCVEFTRITGVQEEALFTANSWLRKVIITNREELTPFVRKSLMLLWEGILCEPPIDKKLR
jgi:predicted nucleic acid-binding protein